MRITGTYLAGVALLALATAGLTPHAGAGSAEHCERHRR